MVYVFFPRKMSVKQLNIGGRPVTSLGHQVGRRDFYEGPKFFKLYLIVINYVQHFNLRGGENNFRGS